MVKRVWVEKKEGFNVEAKSLTRDIRSTLGKNKLESIRIINCYDVEGLDSSELDRVKDLVLAEPNIDNYGEGELPIDDSAISFRVALLPGQYDQRADSAVQCAQIVTLNSKVKILSSKVYVLNGDLTEKDTDQIKSFIINPIESHQVDCGIPFSLEMKFDLPERVEILEEFISLSESKLFKLRESLGLAMSEEDILHVQRYFRDVEERNPTITEIKVIDTYWSDHCRHTTFMTEISSVKIPKDHPAQIAYDKYLEMRREVYGNKEKPMCLMDLATINAKWSKKQGLLEDLDESDEINACSIRIDVDINGEKKPHLLMFKNETHNHPTEIEPYGGAATCLGGAIRDPLSGRAYVYQGMRVTGAASPLTPISDTIEGKLPQRIITQKASSGFSSYGNQIGLTTGLVSEIYHPGYVAKRMEVGAVIGAAPIENVIRKKPECGDRVILLGGRTGRDGVGGATGSSKAHDEESLSSCGAEVQKGNPPEERKIQRLFRKPEVTKLIKKCNDFGAGGVSVAIGELADSLYIDLDKVTKKYEGLDGTELALSESQERMAVVVSPANVDEFLNECSRENIEATVVAEVTDSGRLIMEWNNQVVFDVSREFLDTNGVRGKTKVEITETQHVFAKPSKESLLDQLKFLCNCSQRGLVEKFDNTIGSSTVLMPFGGKYELTPVQSMVAKIPVLEGETDTVSIMSYGFDPYLSEQSTFHGGYYAVIESISKLVATGGNYRGARLSLQEYFEKLGSDPQKWGKPFSALLGASYAQYQFKTAAIGGKDSMSGTFKDINVPPTLISFAVTPGKASKVISPELKSSESYLYLLKIKKDDKGLVDIDMTFRAYDHLLSLIEKEIAVSAYAIGKGGALVALSKMSFGNKIGFKLHTTDEDLIFGEDYGNIVFESKDLLEEDGYNILIGRTTPEGFISYLDQNVPIEDAISAWEFPLEDVFATKYEIEGETSNIIYNSKVSSKAKHTSAKPRVFIPVFPGTNCEYDTARAFEQSGAISEVVVFRNNTQDYIKESIKSFVDAIRNSQIIAIPGGFSGGDEPEGSAKFISSVLRNQPIMEEILDLLNNRDGLMLGICNGFQALVKLGLLPYGEFRNLDVNSPTLTFNTINRHIARLARVRVSSDMSPWLSGLEVGSVYQTAFSHGEGRFVASSALVEEMKAKGQIATQYADLDGNASMDSRYNPNGSTYAIEGITSTDGRILGKMGHVERRGYHLYKNIHGNTNMDIFTRGVRYFKD